MRDDVRERQLARRHQARERADLLRGMGGAVVQPRSPFSDSSSSAGSDTSTPRRAIPTTIAVAPGRSTSQAWRIVAGCPTASNAWSTPPPGTSASTAATGLGGRAGTASVAPARRRQLELRRIAVDGDDPARAGEPRPPATICSPTPPQPITHTRLARRRRAPRCARRRRR